MTLHANAWGRTLFFVFLGFDGFEIFGLEDLAAVQALDIIDPVPAGENDRPGMLTNGLHNQYGKYSIHCENRVKPHPYDGYRAGPGGAPHRDGRRLGQMWNNEKGIFLTRPDKRTQKDLDRRGARK